MNGFKALYFLKVVQDIEFVNRLILESQESCDFCMYANLTVSTFYMSSLAPKTKPNVFFLSIDVHIQVNQVRPNQTPDSKKTRRYTSIQF